MKNETFILFRLTLLQDTYRSHQREYEKYEQDIKSSKTAIQNLENAPDQNLNYKFYKGMKIYVENIIDCLNEKVYINILKVRTLPYWSVSREKTGRGDGSMGKGLNKHRD